MTDLPALVHHLLHVALLAPIIAGGLLAVLAVWRISRYVRQHPGHHHRSLR